MAFLEFNRVINLTVVIVSYAELQQLEVIDARFELRGAEPFD